MICEKQYHTLQGYECLSACISNYLFYNNINVTASDIFFLGNGFNVYYEEDTKRILTDIYNANYNFLEKYNVKYSIFHASDENEGRQILKESIENELMLIIKVSAESLKYNRIYNQAGDSPHFINVIGQRENEVYVSDGFVPTRKFSVYYGWTNLYNILSAWSKQNYEYFIIDKVNFLSDFNVKEKVWSKIHEGIEKYIKGERSNGIINGYPAMIEVLDNLRRRLEEKEEHLEKRTLYLNHQLRICGFVSSKKMLLQQIKVFGEDNELINKYGYIVNRWSKLLMLLVKVGFSRKIDDFNNMYSKMMECINSENELLEEIYNYSKSK